ncbi:MAG: hypothetical protein K0R57_2819 [Paenibacillaceae bacterium]|nr:hypothetical protein [Paenibacillaceae bacterium]
MNSLPPLILQGVLFTALLLYASICDLKTRQIPNHLSLLIGIVGLIHGSLILACVGLLITGLPYLMAAVLSQGKIGGGDIKLMAACGFVLGPVHGTLQSIVSLTLVLLFAIGIGFRSGLQTAKQTALPLAPFLSVGGIFVYWTLHFG